MYDRFLIGPESEGLVTALKPWAIPENSYETLNNMYVWRGRVRKRCGAQLMGTTQLQSRFRVGLGNTNGAGAIAGVVDGSSAIGQQFSIGVVIFTVISNAAGPIQMLRSDGSVAAATFNFATGAFNIIGAPAVTPAYFYPGYPVMGLCNYAINAANNHPSYGFDTEFAYTYTAGGWLRVGAADGVLFHGDDTDFFWATNWIGATPDSTCLFVSNFNATIGVPGANDDPMWSFNINRAPNPWLAFTPQFTTAGDTVQTARIILPFKGHLVLLNTIEQNAAGTANTGYEARCRYCANGSPFAPNAWLQANNLGYIGGGYIDAATSEAIVSASFIKDRLIVYFERSTWELAYTGNDVVPLAWQKINTELGAESTFSVVPFDRVILGIGNTGVHACNGANVERIDSKIPDQIFHIVDKSEGVARIAGIRDYYNEMVYWSFPQTDQPALTNFPTKILAYNYVANTWSFFDDCMTAFGYFEQQTDRTWADMNMPWNQNNTQWNSGVLAANFRQVIAGNQQGYVFIVAADIPYNCPSMSVTNLAVVVGGIQFTVMNHSLSIGDFIWFEDMNGIAGLNTTIQQVETVISNNIFTIAAPVGFAGTYLGGGTLTRVSRLELRTKCFNPYISKGRNVYVAKIDFGVDRTEEGEITVDYYASNANLSMLTAADATQCTLSDGTLSTFPYPGITAGNDLESQANLLWHSIYFQSDGEFIQLYMYLNYIQMIDPDVAFSDFVLHGMVLHTMATASRLE